MPPVAPPRDRRFPLAEVCFRIPVQIPGHDLRKQTVCAERDGVQPFYDPELRAVVIGDRLYFTGDAVVESVVRAKAAIAPK